jgi:signal transduction histidine kinase
MFRSIKTKIMVMQMGLVLSVVVGLGIVSYLIAFSSLRGSQQQNLESLAMYVGTEVSEVINSKGRLLEKIASAETVTNYSKRQDDTELAKYFEKYSQEFPILTYVNEKGMEELKVLNGKVMTELSSMSNSTIFERAMNNPNKAFNSYTAFCPEIGGPCIEFGLYNVNFFDEFVGFVSSEIPVTVLTANIRKFDPEQLNLTILVDSAGTILTCRDKDKILKEITVEGTDSEHIVSEIKAMKSGFDRAVIAGVDGYFAYSPVPGQSWSVVAVLPYQQFVAKLSTLRNTVLLVGMTMLILGAALSLFFAADMTQPILELVEKTTLLANGDFSQKIDIKSKDEIGTLAESFNNMAENLQKTTTSIVDFNRELAEREKAEHTQQELNEELKEAIEKLTAANRDLADFAHVAAHDLKSPLRAIGSLAGIIAAEYGDKLDEQGRQYLDILIGRTERMSELIKGILRYSELGYTREEQLVDLNEVIDETIAEIALPGDIEVIKENDFPVIMCNKTHMMQLFQNLLSNAIKYMDKPKGYVRLGCVEDGSFWKFSVADNGCGIDPKYFDKIFKVFQTLTRRDERESVGMGLSEVRRIIEKYDGKIWVESEPEKGSTFYFTLPKQEAEIENEKFQTNNVS